MNAVAYLLAFISLLMGGLLILGIKAPLGIMVLFPKLVAGAHSPVWGVTGLLGAALDWLGHALLAVAGGCIGAVCIGWCVWSVTAPQRGFEKAFGVGWPPTLLIQGEIGRLIFFNILKCFERK